MITNLILKDFKIHNNLNIQLGNITLLTGQNGMGKSSVIQSMLLLRQSYTGNAPLAGLNLKGDLADLGIANDVECHSCSDGVLNIQLEDDSETLNFEFSYEDTDSYETYLPAINVENQNKDLSKCSLFTSNFQYISAFRYGPQKGYERDTNVVQHQKQISKINGQCEYAIHFLSHFGNKIHCIPELLYDNENNDLLSTQVQLWMQQVSPRVNINIEPNGNDFKLNYKFSREGNTMTEPMSAINVGYGISYVLPIIIAVLSASPGAILLIENPEAHIHPRAQAELMKLLMKAAKAGIQIIIETHSDHIMNGALVAIVNEPEYLPLVKAYYFERDESQHTSKPCKLEILEDGRVANPPKGFFDQIDIDMRTIMGF
jgi:predicted ATPase